LLNLFVYFPDLVPDDGDLQIDEDGRSNEGGAPTEGVVVIPDLVPIIIDLC
jgi:hypothetical protein